MSIQVQAEVRELREIIHQIAQQLQALSEAQAVLRDRIAALEPPVMREVSRGR